MENMNVLVIIIKEKFMLKKMEFFGLGIERPVKKLNWLKSFSRNKKESSIEEDFIKILKIK